MNRIAFKLAASSAIVSMTMFGFVTPSQAMRRFGAPVAATAQDRQATRLYEQASRDLQRGALTEALAAMEQAVSLSPRDAGYRLLLADIYLRSGRFDSARATYGDVLQLDPDHVRAGLSYALTQIALGRPQAAVGQLENISSRAPAADVGLAFALAGASDRAIEILEPAARSHNATPRIRQNLALAYALSGDWARARVVAAQDVSPAELGERMEQWAGLARPGASAARVAGLLGVSPSDDAGQPVALALNKAAAAPTEAFAAAEPVAIPAPAVQAAAPVAAPAEAPAFWVPTAQSYQPAPAPEAEAAFAAAADEADAPQAPPVPSPAAQVRYAAAAQSLVRPEPALIRADTAPARMPAPVFQRARASVPVVSHTGNSRAVVQIGAFSNEGNAERAWQTYAERYALSDRRPLTTTILINGRTLHRVSVAGFDDAGQAHQLCGQIRARGGGCFVRGQAGDASIRWAARYANPRQRNA
jgi:Flp pilus assembly protein TadD